MKTDLKSVHTYRDRHGKRRCYYRRLGQKQRIECEVGSPEWLENYSRIHQSFERSNLPATEHETLHYAIEDYLRNARYQKLAASSRRAYRTSLNELSSDLGHRKMSEFSRGHIVQIRDAIASRSKSMAALAVKTLNLEFEHARDFDMIDERCSSAGRAEKNASQKMER